MGAIKRSGLFPEQVAFEVTKSAEVKDAKRLRNILGFYRKSGFRVALDDLGPGLTSLNLLGTLRPDFAKLDIDLVREADRDPYRAVNVSKLLEIAKDLGVTVLAEGVEIEEQRRWLVGRGADFAQGYFFAKPAFPPPISASAYV